MKKLLLTGGTGFIGKNILPILSKKYEVYAPTRSELDLRDDKLVAEYVKKGKFDYIIQGANPNPVKNSLCDSQEKMFEDSMRIFMNFYNVREYCEKLFYFGSGAEYNKNSEMKMVREEQMGEEIPYDAYGLAKMYMNELARNSENVYNLRIFGCYGPYDHESKFLTHVIRCCLNKEDIVIRQNCVFDYMQIYDLAYVIECLTERKLVYHDFNICTAKPIELVDIAKKIKNAMNSESNIVVEKDGYNKEYTADNKRFLNQIDYDMEFTSIDEGIQIQIEYEKRAWK